MNVASLYRDAVEVDRADVPLRRPDDHTMGSALDVYVSQRVPQDLLRDALARAASIEVHGIYPAHVSSVVHGAALRGEGHEFRPTKVFNRIRPHYFEAPRAGGTRLVVAVPPGRDYVMHYASLVTHCLRAHGAPDDALARVVRYPVAEETIAGWTGLAALVEPRDRVLIGYVQELVPLLVEAGAHVAEQRDNDFYSAIRLRFGDTREHVCALGVRFSFWGCIAGRLAVACQRAGATEIVYAGKLGTLTAPDDIYRRLFAPSRYLHLGGETIPAQPCPGPRNGVLELWPDLDTGVHMSVGTVIEEDTKQRLYADRFGVSSIDNEIAQIALALARADGGRGTAFSALHFATDYLRRSDEAPHADIYNLTNHRRGDALERKADMLREIADRLQKYYKETSPARYAPPAALVSTAAEHSVRKGHTMDLHTELDGVRISRIGLGCSNFGKRIDSGRAREVVAAALDAGVNFFDVADVYGGGTAESILGEALRGRRDEAIVATKFGHATKESVDPSRRGGHPENVIRSAEASLRALGTDRIDLFQIHEPDPTVPVADTLEALDTLVRQGKVRWAGCSNFSVGQVRDAHTAGRERGLSGFRTVQNEYSLLVRDAEGDVIPYCRESGLRLIPYFPLASGVLTGKYRMDARVPAGTRVANMKPDKLFRFFTPRALDLVEKLVVLGEQHGHTVLELSLGFLLAEPVVLSVIAGAMNGEQARANAEAARRAATIGPEVVDALRALP